MTAPPLESKLKAERQDRPHLVGVFALASLFAFGVPVVWETILAVNARLSPGIPWYPVAGAGVLILLGLLLSHRWMPRRLLPPRRGNLRTIVTVWGLILSSLCLNLLSLSFVSMPITGARRVDFTSPLMATTFLIVAPLFSAFVEEIVFRGIIQPALERALGVLWAVALTSLLFVVSHYSNAAFWVLTPFYFVFSYGVGLLAWRTDSLFYPMAVHAGVNLAGAVIVLNGPVNPAQFSDVRVVLGAGALLLGALTFFCARGQSAISDRTR